MAATSAAPFSATFSCIHDQVVPGEAVEQVTLTAIRSGSVDVAAGGP